MSEQLFQKRQRKNKEEKEKNRKLKPFRILIVCEGEKTEPYYFEYFRKQINEKYGKTGGIDIVEIDGTGRNTRDLVDYTERKVKEAKIGFGNIWCVFDKDSFTDDQFNTAVTLCKQKGYKCAWSNECIELWFLLHFKYLNTAIDRDSYKEKLNKIFNDKKINNGKYDKNLKNMYKILKEHGDEEKAIAYAKKLEGLYEQHDTPSKRKPATTVFELVEELNRVISE